MFFHKADKPEFSYYLLFKEVEDMQGISRCLSGLFKMFVELIFHNGVNIPKNGKFRFCYFYN